MVSNLILIICLLIGLAAGFFSNTGGQSRIHGRLLFASVLILLFSMGVTLGFAPDLRERMGAYGYNALIISICTLFFSAVAVAVIVKITKFGKRL